MGQNINWVGALFWLVTIVTSGAAIVLYSVGTTPDFAEQLVIAATGLAALAFECVALHRIAHNWRVGRGWASAICVFILPFAILITLSYELGFLARIFETSASVGESHASARHTLERERKRLEAQVEKAGVPRPVAAIEGDLAGVKANPRWVSSRQCSDITAPESKGLCAEYGRYSAELGAATAIAGATARITEITGQLNGYATAGVADARAAYLSRAGLPELDSRFAVAALSMVFLMCYRVGGGYVFADRWGRGEGGPPAVASPVVAEMSQNSNAPEKATEARTAEFAPPLPETAAQLPSPALPDALASMGEDEGTDLTPDEIDRLYAESQAEPLVEAMNLNRAERVEAPEADLSSLSDADLKRREIVLRFSRDCLTFLGPDSDEFEEGTLLWNAYETWAKDMEVREMTTQQAFGRAFNGYMRERSERGRAKSSNTRYYGVKINPLHTHRMTFGSTPVEDFTNDQPRRLGSMLRDNLSLAAESPAAGTA
jgi:hypothetical protein